ncbi:QRFP-like peptide receptor [Oculina patagonica]
MSDQLFPIFLVPVKTTRLYVDSWLISGHLGQALCKLVPFLQNVSFTVSVQSLVLIAVDRFGAVVFPLRSPLISSKLCPFFILATWIIAMAINPYRPAFVFNFFIPFVLIAILYTIIYLKLKSQKIPGEQSTNATQQRVKRERNVLKMAIAIVLGFAVCWLPSCILWILILFVSDISSCGFEYFVLVAECLALANCALNPCICFLFSENYRQNLRNLLKCFCALQGYSSHTESNLTSGS